MCVRGARVDDSCLAVDRERTEERERMEQGGEGEGFNEWDGKRGGGVRGQGGSEGVDLIRLPSDRHISLSLSLRALFLVTVGSVTRSRTH